MSESFDLNALIVEAEGAEPFRFTWGDREFAMPLMEAMPFASQLGLETATTEQSLRIVLGSEVFDDLVATRGLDGRPLTIGRMRLLVEQWLRFQGLEPGKSRASSPSSNGTAPPSKPTSRSGRGRRTS